MSRKFERILKTGMFSGIITSTASIEGLREQPPFFELCVASSDFIQQDISQGSSISVNGVCLTVKKNEIEKLYFDISPETLARTTLGSLQIGRQVNIERPVTYGEDIGGHMVSGHVDAVGVIKDAHNDQNGIRFQIGCDPFWMKYILQKGSIAIDGVSLTINDPDSDSFFVHLIPETLRRTIFSLYKIGDRVNIECDKTIQAIVDTVERLLKK